MKKSIENVTITGSAKEGYLITVFDGCPTPEYAYQELAVTEGELLSIERCIRIVMAYKPKKK